MVTTVPLPGDDVIATLAVVRGDDRGDDRQAQPGAAGRAGPGRVGAVESIECVRRVVGVHARAVVGHGDDASPPSLRTVSEHDVPSGVWVRTFANRLSSTWRRRLGSPTTTATSSTRNLT